MTTSARLKKLRGHVGEGAALTLRGEVLCDCKKGLRPAEFHVLLGGAGALRGEKLQIRRVELDQIGSCPTCGRK